MKNFLTTKLITATAVSTLAIFISAGVNAEIYKWTDSKGVVHYSAQKPTQRKIKSKNIEDEILSAAGKYKAPKQKATTASTSGSKKEKASSKLSGPEAELVSYCAKQRSNLEQLQKNYRNVWQGIDGKKTKLDQDQRKQKVDYIQQTISENCAGV